MITFSPFLGDASRCRPSLIDSVLLLVVTRRCYVVANSGASTVENGVRHTDDPVAIPCSNRTRTAGTAAGTQTWHQTHAPETQPHLRFLAPTLLYCFHQRWLSRLSVRFYTCALHLFIQRSSKVLLVPGLFESSRVQTACRSIAYANMCRSRCICSVSCRDTPEVRATEATTEPLMRPLFENCKVACLSHSPGYAHCMPWCPTAPPCSPERSFRPGYQLLEERLAGDTAAVPSLEVSVHKSACAHAVNLSTSGLDLLPSGRSYTHAPSRGRRG